MDVLICQPESHVMVSLGIDQLPRTRNFCSSPVLAPSFSFQSREGDPPKGCSSQTPLCLVNSSIITLCLDCISHVPKPVLIKRQFLVCQAIFFITFKAFLLSFLEIKYNLCQSKSDSGSFSIRTLGYMNQNRMTTGNHRKHVKVQLVICYFRQNAQ